MRFTIFANKLKLCFTVPINLGKLTLFDGKSNYHEHSCYTYIHILATKCISSVYLVVFLIETLGQSIRRIEVLMVNNTLNICKKTMEGQRSIWELLSLLYVSIVITFNNTHIKTFKRKSLSNDDNTQQRILLTAYNIYIYIIYIYIYIIYIYIYI